MSEPVVFASMEPNSDVERVMGALYPTVTIDRNKDGAVVGSALFHPQPEHQGAPGWMQGGLSATVLDSFLARLASAALEMKVVTGTLDLRYPFPVPLSGGPYRVVGSSEQPRTRTVRVSAAIVEGADKPLVEATGLFVGVSEL